VLVSAVGRLDHRLGDVHAVDQVEVPAQRLCEASHPAPEIQVVLRGDAERPLVQRLHASVDLELAVGIELLGVPEVAPLLGIADDRPHRVPA
jgi:hypothetical protein